MQSAPLSAQQLVSGAPVWVDTADSRELDELIAREETRRREDNALRVFRRRIASLQLERDLLKQQILEMNEDFARDLEDCAREARSEGIDEGRAAMRRELLAQFTLLGTLEQELRAKGRQQQQQADREILRFARWLAGQVVDHIPDLEGEHLRSRIRRLLDHWVGESSYRFRLHPEDRRTLMEDGGLAQLARESQARIEWLASPEVPRGGCRLELARGLVEAVPAAMLDEVLAALEQALAAEQPHDGEFPQEEPRAEEPGAEKPGHGPAGTGIR